MHSWLSNSTYCLGAKNCSARAAWLLGQHIWSRSSDQRILELLARNQFGNRQMLSQISAIADLLAATGVIASLIFVGLEIRHNTIISRAATLQQNAAYWQAFFAMAGDPKYGKSFAKGAAAREELSGDEFGQFFFMCRAIFMGCENQHYQYRKRMIDEDEYEGYTATIREQIVSQPGVRAMWSVVRHTYGAQFQSFLDKLVEEASVRQANSTKAKWKQAISSQTVHGDVEGRSV